MIKKHLLACSVLLVLTMLIKMFILPAKNIPATVKTPHSELTLRAEVTKKNTKTSLNFANEDLPLGDAKVNYRIYKALKSNSFERLQTTVLHRKAEKWFPVIEPILRIYGIPDDFKYIPLVESGLQSGTSPRGASGYWQFMPGTARTYGLKVNSVIDERQDMRKSTIAACRYLKEMYGTLQSWTLVAAAYNFGDVKLKQQINRQNQDNYFKLKLNSETGSYVYKLISMKQIIEDPVRYGYAESPHMLAYSANKRKFIDPLIEKAGIEPFKLMVN